MRRNLHACSRKLLPEPTVRSDPNNARDHSRRWGLSITLENWHRSRDVRQYNYRLSFRWTEIWLSFFLSLRQILTLAGRNAEKMKSVPRVLACMKMCTDLQIYYHTTSTNVSRVSPEWSQLSPLNYYEDKLQSTCKNSWLIDFQRQVHFYCGLPYVQETYRRELLLGARGNRRRSVHQVAN